MPLCSSCSMSLIINFQGGLAAELPIGVDMAICIHLKANVIYGVDGSWR